MTQLLEYNITYYSEKEKHEKHEKNVYVWLINTRDNVILQLGTFDKLGGAKLLEKKGGENMNKKDLLILSLVIIIFLLLFLLFIVII